MEPIRRTLVFLLVIGSVAGCTIPERENPNDPRNKPVAILDVKTVEGGRATPFELDAGASYDPRRPEETLRFRWELNDPLHDDVEEDELDDFDDIPGNQALVFATFPDVFVVNSNGEGSVLRTVRVKVIAADGAFSIAQGTIVIRNERPIVDPGEDLFVASNRTLPVVMDALGGGNDPTSIDADGDSVYFEWTQFGGDPVTLDTSLDPIFKRRVSFVPPPPSPNRQSLTFRLEGSDGMSSETAFLRVHFGTQLWMASRLPTTLFRSFPEFQTRTELTDVFGAPVAFSNVTAIAVTSSGNIWTAEPSGSDTVVRLLDEDLRQVSQTTVPGFANPMWAEAAGEDLCLMIIEGEFGGASAFVRVDELGVATTPIPVTRGVRTHAAGSGECWVVGGVDVQIANAAGNLVPVSSGYEFIYRSTVDEQGNLWFDERESQTSHPIRIVRLAPDGTSTDVHQFAPVPLGENPPTVTDMAPRKGGGIWVHNALRELLFLSPDGEVTVTDAPRMRLDAMAQARRQFVSDLADGTIWLADSQSGDLVHLLDAGDTVRELDRLSIESAAPGAPFFLTPHRTSGGGIIASATGTESWIFRIPTHMRSGETVNAGLITTFPDSVSGDTLRGAAWIADGATFEQRVIRTTHLGRHLVSIPLNGNRVQATTEGGAWISYFNDASSSGAVLRVSPTGEILFATDIPGNFAEDFEANDNVACTLSHDGEGGVMGIRVEARGSPEVLLEQPGVGEYTGSCWIDRADGATWIQAAPYDCFPGSGQRMVHRYEPGETTPSLVVTSHGGEAIGCEMSGDENGGVWIETASGMARWTEGAFTGETVDAVGRVVPCAGGGGASGCREVWRIDEEANLLLRSAADGTLIQSYDSAGPLLEFDVIP